MQSVLSRNWTRIAVSIFCDDNHYTTGTSTNNLFNCYWYFHAAKTRGMSIPKSQWESSSSSCRATSTDIPDLSRHFSLSFISFGRSSGLHPVSPHSCLMYVRAGRPAFAWPYAGVHRCASRMSSSLQLQQCPACLARLTCIVFVMGDKWPYSWCLVGCCRQDLFNIALNILV